MRGDGHMGRVRQGQGGLQRRQRPGDEFRKDNYGRSILECIRSCEADRRCFDARCVCSAADNDALAGCIEYDCGRTAYQNYREDLIAECPRAFDYNRRPGEAGPSRNTSANVRTTPAPQPQPQPQPQTTPRTTATPVQVAPRPAATTSSAVVRQPAPAPAASSESPRLPTSAAADARESAVPEATSAESLTEGTSGPPLSDSLVESQSLASGVASSNGLTSLPFRDDAARESVELDGASASDLRSVPLSSIDGDNAPDPTISNDAPRITQDVPALRPLGPSSPGEVSKLNSGVIAGIIIGILAVIALFIAFWYRSYRRRKRMERASAHLSSVMHTHQDDPSGSAAWTEFGGAKGSMISGYEEGASEKNAPIYSMFSSSRRALPSSPMMSSIHRSQSTSTAGIPSAHHVSRHSSRASSGRRGLGNMKSRWMDGGVRSPPPSYPVHTGDSVAVPAPAYKRPPGTSFFARLLGNPIERKAVQPTFTAPELPHPHFNSPQPYGGSPLASLPEEGHESYRDSADLDALTEEHYRSYGNSSNGNSMLAPNSTPLSPKKIPTDSVYEGDKSGMSMSRPSFAWSARSLPQGMSVFDDGPEEGATQRATSTRAPSLDLAWVTEGEHRIPVPSWAAPRRRPSMKSKKSSRSAHHWSMYRHSIMSAMSSGSAPSRSAHSSTGPIPDMPHLSSIPSFRLEIGADKAKAILQLLVNTPTTPNPTDSEFTAEMKSTELCKDESRPISVIDDACYTPNLRDSVKSC